jgi:hypothetical protein
MSHAKTLLEKLTGMVNACNEAFKQIEEHENILDAKIAKLEERISHLEEG